ncbi:MAG TPA: carboxymuconolactone decarboxylase family protein [Leptospiraceae bacterium]|nr:carboxymuconolactone decarboxylase family protein [Leptospiraceae bacterium]HMW03535.1 carboxymuconolactone decarboxylase family protein [Leptospiraceae bacterium]HMX33902.1 carboxymuconolactone decarboxylase family protein [Leptospiraceae bacterium]HMY29545.1 carboxymuconolactone decarboxylase family protein [Leptospiraceae bacterium]HMZ64815.1 carboxymuconolactone decarboxylase family protein [Leptospiraceae bacterium]
MEFQKFNSIAPNIVKALRDMTQSVDATGLEKTLTELIKIRVSQINGCAYCLQFHINLARKSG